MLTFSLKNSVKIKPFLILFLVPVLISCTSTFRLEKNNSNNAAIKTGAEQTELYLPYLKGKRVAILANQTTIIGKKHLVDSLQSLGINIVKVFGTGTWFPRKCKRRRRSK